MDQNQRLKIISEGQKHGVSKVCTQYNISRTIYYRWLKRFKAQGADGLKDQSKNFTPVNKTTPEIEAILLNLFRQYPHYGPKAIKYLLEEMGYFIGESAIFNVMKRFDLTNKNQRLKYARKRKTATGLKQRKISDYKSGECWLFWTTDYGNHNHVGHIYEYTFFDVKSKIACTRLYNSLSYDNFEDLLMAVALPVAQTLSFDTKCLYFFDRDDILTQNLDQVRHQITKTIHSYGFDLSIHQIKDAIDIDIAKTLKSVYTHHCLSFIMPLLKLDYNLAKIKIDFQKYIRAYNIVDKNTYDGVAYSPIEYHLKATNSKLILPLWAYMDRKY